ncbi:hypothetical protein HY839_01740, partial [Candidatus Azambacteria bacterium]|nr:hypothetical protein [Candidatus Azambacteria bacterium]
RNGIIGSSVYKIKTLAKFMGFDTTTAEFSTRMSQYFITTGGSEAEQNADLDRRVRNVLRDVYMYYTGIFSQTDEMLPPQKRNIVSSCGQDAILGYYCELTSIGANREKVKIFKDARTKLEELQNDFSLMVEETSKVSEEFQTLFSNITAQKQNLEDLVKLLSNLRTDYDQGNACVGIPTDASNLWKPTGTQAAIANLAPLNQVFKSNWFESIFGYYSRKARKKMQEEAERRERERQALLQSCRTGISNYNKHLGQLADQFVCNKTNPKYE